MKHFLHKNIPTLTHLTTNEVVEVVEAEAIEGEELIGTRHRGIDLM
jgi:hypothetical protein